MAISRYKKPLLIKFSQGNATGEQENSKLGSWQVAYYTRSAVSGSIQKQLYGLDDNYDLVVIFTANPITKQITENTLFLIDEYPTDLNSEGNYTARRVIVHDDNQIVVGLNKVRGVKHANIYYYDGGNLYACQVNYDSDTQKVYVNKYSTLPLVAGTAVWTSEPASEDDTTDAFTVSSVATVGIVSDLLVFKEISLTQVE